MQSKKVKIKSYNKASREFEYNIFLKRFYCLSWWKLQVLLKRQFFIVLK